MSDINEIRNQINKAREHCRHPIPTCGVPSRCEFCYKVLKGEYHYINLPIVECYICSECKENITSLFKVVSLNST
jgi:hypothetical protein